ncbi:hypothetical protein FV228_23350 [Methylobacterium sp. WL18]|uniref:hypothetical protein n=1 Tax=Methylobacterium sp. WL18 TaxID=2603897 RepID=UPI0011C6F305|nr:hypothetical protein [Methylobacterium sp. WL18]TXN60386.1 hypothetical protein FV228_23350 [Methylobacterium sp. WL18]
MKNVVRNLLYKIAPDFMRLRAARIRRKINYEIFRDRQTSSRKSLFDNRDIKILSGPFAGLRYIDEITWGPIEPKWLGTYEFELHPILRDIIASSYNEIVDVGSAEGFYSIGLAWKCPSSTVFAFDVDPISREQQRRLASLNGVENLVIRKFCKNEDLQKLISDKTLVICDIEGHEIDLLNIDLTPRLKNADILVELHNTATRSMLDIEKEITNRFLKSHSIAVINFNPDIIARKSSLLSTEIIASDVMFDEYRDTKDQKWLWMKHI